MASLSNINGLFDVHSTGAILFSTSHGLNGQILRSNGDAAPTWVAASTVIGGPYLPLTGGALSGPLSGTSATFSGDLTVTGNQYFNGSFIEGDGKEMFRYSDLWLRINEDSDFTSGIYCGTGILRTDGQFEVGSSGTKFKVTSAGVVTALGNITAPSFNGLAINTTGTNNVANQIVRTQANGYVNFGWINSISGATTSTITRITASNDAYLRYVTPATFRTQITDPYYAPTGTVSGVTSVATGNGLTGGTITSTGTLSLDRPNSQLGAVLATYGTTAGSAGRIRITAPFATNSAHMFSIEVTLYTSYTQYNYVVSAYMYPSTNQWLNPKAIYTTTGTATPDIYVGRDANGKAYISIANGSYTGVLVHNMTRGYQTSLADTYDPWTITVNSGNENSVSVATSQVWTTANLPSPVQSSGVTSVATGSGLTGGTITTTGTLSVDSTVIRTTGNQSMSGVKTFTTKVITPILEMTGVPSRVKLNVWSGSTYGFGMQSGYTFGGLSNNYAITCQMSNTAGRGFWWGDSAHTNAQGAMALTTTGQLTVATSMRIGYGESDTSSPGAYVLQVNGSINAGRLYIGDGDGFFYSDTANRTAFSGAQFYIQSSVPTYYNYATNQYHGNSSGDNHYFRGNPLTGNSWSITAGGAGTFSSLVSNGTITSGTSSTGNIYCGKSTSTHFRFHTVSNSTYFDMNSGNISWRQGSSTRYIFYSTTANMTIYGTLTQGSDIRIKENIVEIGNCIDKVKSIRGVYYNRTDFNTEPTKIGVIAQEVEEQMPELVHDEPTTGIKSVSYTELTAVLVNAIKEQQVIIDDLKSRIEKLEL